MGKPGGLLILTSLWDFAAPPPTQNACFHFTLQGLCFPIYATGFLDWVKEVEDFWASLGSDLLELCVRHMRKHVATCFAGSVCLLSGEHKCKMGAQRNVSMSLCAS